MIFGRPANWACPKNGLVVGAAASRTCQGKKSRDSRFPRFWGERGSLFPLFLNCWFSHGAPGGSGGLKTAVEKSISACRQWRRGFFNIGIGRASGVLNFGFLLAGGAREAGGGVISHKIEGMAIRRVV